MITKTATVLLGALLSFASLNVNSSDYDKNYSLHGSRASFLMKDNGWMTLNYFHPDAAKQGMINSAKNNGDTHFYIYSRNGGDNAGGYDLRYIEPKADWEKQLEHLINSGLKPVMWLTPDDSPKITRLSMAQQKAHFDSMVARFDKQLSAYVVCLECDEYWSPAMVNELVRHLKTKTNKPVAVHLTSGVGGHKGNLEYYKGADYVFLQTGWNKSHAQIQAMVKDAMVKTGLPVVLSEYAQESRSATARAMGDAGCAAGAVGTGNGRSITFCGEELVPEKKDRTEEYIMIAGAVAGAAVLAYGVYWFNQNYEINLHLGMNFTDEYQNITLGKDFNLFQKNDTSLNFGIELGQTLSDDYNEGRVLFSLKGTF